MTDMLHGGLAVDHFGSLPLSRRDFQTNPSNNDTSTRDTLQLMTAIARGDAGSPIVQAAAAEAIASSTHGPYPNPIPPIGGIFQWVKRHVQFVEDETVLAQVWGYGADKELLIHPSKLLTMPRPQGDCDDFSMLVASMVLASQSLTGINMGVEFVTIAVDDNHPDRWSHVYTLVELEDGSRIPIDASHGEYVGWEADGVYRKQYYPVTRVKRIPGLGRMVVMGGREW